MGPRKIPYAYAQSNLKGDFCFVYNDKKYLECPFAEILEKSVKLERTLVLSVFLAILYYLGKP